MPCLYITDGTILFIIYIYISSHAPHTWQHILLAFGCTTVTRVSVCVCVGGGVCMCGGGEARRSQEHHLPSDLLGRGLFKS